MNKIFESVNIRIDRKMKKQKGILFHFVNDSFIVTVGKEQMRK